MDKYYWSFDGEAELWYNTGASIEDCLEQARAENEDGYPTVFIGESVPFSIEQHLRVDQLLDQMEEDAYEFCGCAAEDWMTYDYKKRAELDELKEAIAPIVEEWLKKYGRYPTFHAIENIGEYGPLRPGVLEVAGNG